MQQGIRVKWLRVVLSVLAVISSGGVCSAAGKLPNLWRATYPDITANGGKLTRFWSPEAAAAPEGHAFIARLVEQGFSFHTPAVGILDINLDPVRVLADTRVSQALRDNLSESLHNAVDMLRALTASAGIGLTIEELDELAAFHRRKRQRKKKEHGTAVARLINGQPPVGISRKGETDYMSFFAGLVEKEQLIWQGIVAMTPPLDILNISAELSGTSLNKNEVQVVEITVSYVREVAAKTIVVTSAGNNFPNPTEANKRRLAKAIITVGSTDPDGRASSFSAAGDMVTISAPSGNYLQTIDAQGFRDFGGTSGATPLVTGALADVLSILPSLRIDEAAWLLRETAITSKNTTEAKDTIRSLNYYKLIRVAHRLARDWPQGRDNIFTREYYDFAEEAARLTTAAVALGTTDEAFFKLRQAFFLDDNNHTARKALANIYRRAGYEAQARFYGGEYVSIAKSKATLHRFLTALADADLGRMTEILPTLDKELFRRSFFHAIILHMPEEKRRGVLEFLRTKGVVNITISDRGGLIIKWPGD